MSDEWLATEVEIYTLEGVPVQIFTVAKTVCDCFKYGRTDVAIEALRDAIRQRKVTRGELYKVAKMGKIWDMLRPYLESVP